MIVARNDDRKLRKLGWLERKRSDVDPTRLSFGFRTDKDNRRTQSERHQIRQTAHSHPEPVRDSRDDDHRYDSKTCRKQLLFQIMRRIPETRGTIVRARAVEHHQTETKQKDNQKQQAVIKISNWFLFFSFSITVTSCRYLLTLVTNTLSTSIDSGI